MTTVQNFLRTVVSGDTGPNQVIIETDPGALMITIVREDHERKGDDPDWYYRMSNKDSVDALIAAIRYAGTVAFPKVRDSEE